MVNRGLVYRKGWTYTDEQTESKEKGDEVLGASSKWEGKKGQSMKRNIDYEEVRGPKKKNWLTRVVNIKLLQVVHCGCNEKLI